jgi:hypothetical protein
LGLVRWELSRVFYFCFFLLRINNPREVNKFVSTTVVLPLRSLTMADSLSAIGYKFCNMTPKIKLQK